MRAQPSVKSGQTNPSVLTADPRCPPNGTIYFKQFLEGKFWFDAEGHLTNFIGTRRSHDEENAFASYILEHPEITRAEAITELKKRGAKFGPNDKAAFVQNLPISKLETFLGNSRSCLLRFPSGLRLPPQSCDLAGLDGYSEGHQSGWQTNAVRAGIRPVQW